MDESNVSKEFLNPQLNHSATTLSQRIFPHQNLVIFKQQPQAWPSSTSALWTSPSLQATTSSWRNLDGFHNQGQKLLLTSKEKSLEAIKVVKNHKYHTDISNVSKVSWLFQTWFKNIFSHHLTSINPSKINQCHGHTFCFHRVFHLSNWFFVWCGKMLPRPPWRQRASCRPVAREVFDLQRPERGPAAAVRGGWAPQVS